MTSTSDQDDSPGGSNEADLTIAQMGEAYNVSLRTLRFYEQRGLIEPRRHGAVRLYDADARVRLELILAVKRLGFSLREIEQIVTAAKATGRSGVTDVISRLSRDRLRERIIRLEAERAEIQAAIEELQAALAAKPG